MKVPFEPASLGNSQWSRFMQWVPYRGHYYVAKQDKHGIEVSIYDRNCNYIIRTMGFLDAAAAIAEARAFIDLRMRSGLS